MKFASWEARRPNGSLLKWISFQITNNEVRLQKKSFACFRNVGRLVHGLVRPTKCNEVWAAFKTFPNRIQHRLHARNRPSNPTNLKMGLLLAVWRWTFFLINVSHFGRIWSELQETRCHVTLQKAPVWPALATRDYH